jgi:transposase-like protein
MTTTYDPKHCKRVIALGRRGKSMVEMASALNIPKTTLQSWRKSHPEFGRAIELANAHALAYMEHAVQRAVIRLRNGIPKQDPDKFNKRTRRRNRRWAREKFNEGLWIAEMMRRFPKEYGYRVSTARTVRSD